MIPFTADTPFAIRAIMKNPITTPYTVAMVEDIPDGQTHGSTDARATTCGLNIDHNWMVLSNAFDGAITCPKCCAAIRNKAYSELP